MECIFKDTQVTQISNHLGITKKVVNDILTYYVGYLKSKLESGETVKFLNVCYLKVGGKDIEVHETLAYISNIIGKELDVTQSVVYRVLTSFEDFLIKDLQNLNSYSIRGLIRIKLEKNYKGEWKVRTKKSTAYNNWDIYITTLPSFKRRAEAFV